MKKNAVKFIYILLNIIFFAVLAVFCYFNIERTTDYYCAIMQKEYSTKLIYLLIAFSAFAYVAGITASLFFKSKSDELCNAYQKRHENISAQKDNDDAKISALQSKIATLEAALQTALKNKD